MYLYLVVASLLMKEVLLLKLLQVTIPPNKVDGESAQLECDYDLESGKLYSVKWYRNNNEFYRYNPDGSPSKSVFPTEGIQVNLQQSDDKKVVLNQVTLKSIGLYRCEISTDAPGFATVVGEGRMEIIDLPRNTTQINEKEKVNVGGDNMVVFNWASRSSYPADTMTWNVDGKKTTEPEPLVQFPLTENPYGLVSTTIGVRIPSDTSVEVQCTITAAPRWLDGNKAVIWNNSITDSKGAVYLVRSSASASTLTTTLLVLPFALFIVALKKSQT